MANKKGWSEIRPRKGVRVEEKVKPKDDGVTRDASGCVESTQSNYERRGLWGPREVEKVKPTKEERIDLAEIKELDEHYGKAEKVKPTICPKCEGELEEDLYNGRVFCRQCHWCGYWDRGQDEKVKPKLICTNCGKNVRVRIFGLCLECSEGVPE